MEEQITRFYAPGVGVENLAATIVRQLTTIAPVLAYAKHMRSLFW